MTDWFRQSSGSYVHADISRLVALMKDFLLERVATLVPGPDGRYSPSSVSIYRRNDMWMQYFKPFQLRQVPDIEGVSGPETATLRLSRVARLIRTYQRRIRNRVDRHRQNRVKNTLFFTVDPTEFYRRLAVGAPRPDPKVLKLWGTR